MHETHSGLSLLQLLFQLLSVHLQHLVGFLESTESLHLLQLLLLLGESLCCSLRQGEKENTLKIDNIKMNAFSCDSFFILFLSFCQLTIDMTNKESCLESSFKPLNQSLSTGTMK